MNAESSGYRSVETTFHDLDERRHQVVVSIPTEEIDHHGTSWGAGCFKDSFARRLPDMLREHRRSEYIGRALSAESLRSEARIIGQFEPFETNDTARRSFDDIRSGKLKGWSWRFENGQAEAHPTRSGALRYVRAHMDEFSAVAHPSLESARTTGLRSRDLDTDDLAAALRERFGIKDRAAGRRSSPYDAMTTDQLAEHLELVLIDLEQDASLREQAREKAFRASIPGYERRDKLARLQAQAAELRRDLNRAIGARR